MTKYSGGPCCACIRVEYDPEDVEFENPVTGKTITGKRERWLCRDCGSEFNRVNWHTAVVKQQQDEIERLREVVAVLRVFDEADHHDELWWRVKDGRVKFFVRCNDLFWWGTADAEEITPDNLPLLESTLREAAGTGWWLWAPSVFVARQRCMRPQGACYQHFPTVVGEVFDSCGPPRKTDVLNPKQQPMPKGDSIWPHRNS